MKIKHLTGNYFTDYVARSIISLIKYHIGPNSFIKIPTTFKRIFKTFLENNG